MASATHDLNFIYTATKVIRIVFSPFLSKANSDYRDSAQKVFKFTPAVLIQGHKQTISLSVNYLVMKDRTDKNESHSSYIHMTCSLVDTGGKQVFNAGCSFLSSDLDQLVFEYPETVLLREGQYSLKVSATLPKQSSPVLDSVKL